MGVEDLADAAPSVRPELRPHIHGVLNYGSVRIPAEPLDTRRQDNISVFDIRAEKVIRVDAA